MEAMYNFTGLRGTAKAVRTRGVRLSSFAGDNSSKNFRTSRGTETSSLASSSSIGGNDKNGFSNSASNLAQSPSSSPGSKRSSRMRRWT
eukprot:Pgem_evm1s7053